MKSPNDETFENWNGAVRFKPGFVARPRNLEELKQAIVSSDKVRVMGARHSMNASMAAASNATLIDSKYLKRIGEATPLPGSKRGEMMVTAEAGATIMDLNSALARQGLAMAVLPSSAKITLGGAIAHGVHSSDTGCPGTPGTLCEDVLAMEIINADGEVVVISDEEQLRVARIGLGNLGFTYRITLRAVPAFELLVEEDEVPRAEALEQLAASMREDYYVRFMWDPRSDRVVRRQLSRVSGPVPGATRITGYERISKTKLFFGKLLFGAANKLTFLRHFTNSFFAPEGPEVGPSYYAFQEDFSLPTEDVAVAIPEEHLRDGLERVERVFRQHHYRPQIPVIVRFLERADNTLLGLNSGRDVAVLEIASYIGAKDFPPVARDFERTLREIGGRTHWAKDFHGDNRPAFPQSAWDAYEALRTSLDPNGKFVNAWARRVVL